MSRSFVVALCFQTAFMVSAMANGLSRSIDHTKPASRLVANTQTALSFDKFPSYIEIHPRWDAKSKVKLTQAWQKLISTPTGQDLARRLEGIAPITLGKVETNRDGEYDTNGQWDDEYLWLGLNPKTVAVWPSEHLAWLLGHELEHVYQSEKAGLARNGETQGDHSAALKEERALGLEHRIWVELGSPPTDKLKGGYDPSFGALRKKSYSAYPVSS